VNSKKGGNFTILFQNVHLLNISYVFYFLLLDSSYCSYYCSSNLSKINLMGVILYIWQKRGIFCINFLVKNLESNNQWLFPQTMISRFNLLPRRHFIYHFLIETLFDSCFGKDQSICSHMIKPCDIQEQLFVAQFVLHPQLMSSINASYAGCWFIQSTDNICFLYHPSVFFCWW
jgi:hypothetical protein